VDKGNNFSLYDSEWNTLFVYEIINLLFETLKPINVYKIEMIGQIRYYVNRWEDIAFESDKYNLWDYKLLLELHH